MSKYFDDKAREELADLRRKVSDYSGILKSDIESLRHDLISVRNSKVSLAEAIIELNNFERDYGVPHNIRDTDVEDVAKLEAEQGKELSEEEENLVDMEIKSDKEQNL